MKQPDAWGKEVQGYARFATECTSLFVEDLLRLAPSPAGRKALDLGTGTGVVARAAARAGADVVAVDASPEMVRHVERAAVEDGLESLRATVGNGERLGFPDGAFDVVWSLFGVVLFDDPSRGLAECHRVLAPGGRIAIGAWSTRQDAGRVLLTALRRALPDHRLPAERPPALHLGERREVGAALSEAGFDAVNVVTVRRPWIVPSAEAFWDCLPSYSPTSAAGLDRLSDPERSTLGRQVVHDLWLRFGNGPVALETEAHLALGRRRDPIGRRLGYDRP